MFINNPGHMTKMATMPIQGKKPSKIFFSGTAEPIAMKLGMLQLGVEYNNVLINHDPDCQILRQGQNKSHMQINAESY